MITILDRGWKKDDYKFVINSFNSVIDSYYENWCPKCKHCVECPVYSSCRDIMNAADFVTDRLEEKFHDK